jgi:hypothetical protein
MSEFFLIIVGISFVTQPKRLCFFIFLLPVPVAGFKPSILGLRVERLPPYCLRTHWELMLLVGHLAQCCNFLSVFTNIRNKLECLSLASFSRLFQPFFNIGQRSYWYFKELCIQRKLYKTFFNRNLSFKVPHSGRLLNIPTNIRLRPDVIKLFTSIIICIKLECLFMADLFSLVRPEPTWAKHPSCDPL